MMSQVPLMILNKNTKRDQGPRVQLGNIQAAKVIADIVRTCLGPKAMMKMLLDPTSGIIITNDGNAILREVQVQHPAAKSMIETSRTQDDEVGDGTTSVVILAGELLTVLIPFIEQNIHPIILIRSYTQACTDVVNFLMSDKVCTPVNLSNNDEIIAVIKSSLDTKILHEWGTFACSIALEAVQTIEHKEGNRHEIDIKRYARIEKIPGGSVSSSYVVKGVMLNKDVLHDQMRRHIVNPRVLLLDCSLDFKKGESQTMMEFRNERDFTRALEIEEEAIKDMCDAIREVKADIVVTEKGVSDIAIHHLMTYGISIIRRVRKTDNDRLARATGATIVGDVYQLKSSDVGTQCGLFEVRKIQKEQYAFFEQCTNPKACTIVLRGSSKDLVDEIARNLQDALCVARNILLDPYIVPGGGACEIELCKLLEDRAREAVDPIFSGVEKFPYLAAARALEVIPRVLIKNAGANVIRTLTSLKSKHRSKAEGAKNFGIDGETGMIIDTLEAGIVEPRLVKLQLFKSAIEMAITILRIDDIVSGSKKGSTLDEKKDKEQRENVEKDSKEGAEA
ncbi:hypothetical protein GJ496_008102 [Pomphorhynchus laevis]|nr:hypothetical protein GJ496_008102 [Pomphorhynchus laevis]